MLTIKMTECDQCGDILSLITAIDCRITELGGEMYNKIIYGFGGVCKWSGVDHLIHYKRILIHKWCNPTYLTDFTVLKIASKVKLITGGCVSHECCDECSTTTTTTTTIAPTTTTTTTVAGILCGETSSSGGPGVTEENISMDTDTENTGGIIIIDFSASAVPDKLEIIHDGIKVATTGLAAGNSGPFDNVWGDPSTNYPSVFTDISSIDQFIGTAKSVPDTRDAEFLADTGIIGITATKQQLVWWEYTPSDYLADSNVTIRVVGYQGTFWSLKRVCPPATTTTTTTVAPTTTTTTTLI